MIVGGMCPARITFSVAGLPKGLTCLYFMWVPGCPCWGRMESKGSTRPNTHTHTHTHTHTLSFCFLKKRESGFHGNLTTYRSEASKQTFLDVNQVSPPTCFPRAPKCSVGVSPAQSLGPHSLPGGNEGGSPVDFCLVVTKPGPSCPVPRGRLLCGSWGRVQPRGYAWV